MASQLGIGLIGAGRIGRVHAENLAYRIPQARLLAVADVYAEAAHKLAHDLGIPAAYPDHRRILEDPAIQAVVVCSSTDTHAQMVEEAARAGKHIFCEKPIALDLARIDRALAAVDQAGVKLQVGFQRRFDPSFQRAHEAIRAGQIGVPHILRITSRDPQPPPIEYVRVCGGIFMDMTIHDFDMARFLMGDEVDEVYAACGVLIDPAIGEAGDVDTAVVTLQFANGGLGAIDNSRRAAYGYDQRVEVFGSQGMVTVSNNAPNAAVISDAGGIHAPLPLHFFIERYAEAYVAEMRAFVECVLHDTPPPVTGHDGRVPVVMGYAAKLSLEEHRPVRLSEIE
ncbi:MAG: inositol 2-dehydrogenase [Chloroflexi bacterium]|nr:inositol 2-dehydrogenase [Chloroflexota bacterium]MBU1750951.1 inositol 2-dehydrogenase [Chloroflexota bacterium]